MSIHHPLHNPYLSLYAFFSGQKGEQAAHDWGERLASHLGVPLHDDDGSQIDPSQHVCLIYREHDAWVVYASADMQGAYPLTAWQELSEIIFGAESAAWQTLNEQVWGDDWQARANLFWGVTVFFGAEVTSLGYRQQPLLSANPLTSLWRIGVKLAQLAQKLLRSSPQALDLQPERWLGQLPLLPESKVLSPTLSSQQPWGTLWHLARPSGDMVPSVHIYVVLSTPEQANQVDEILFRRSNIDRVELSLHKSYHQLRQYELGRDELQVRISGLDTALENLLQNSPPEQNKLMAFSTEYVKFAKWASEITELQNTVTINSNNYQKTARRLALLRQEDEVFKRHLQQLKDDQAQLQADKTYFDAATERLGIGLQTIRADLELRLVEKERTEAGRETQRNLLLGRIGILLGLTQIWPILHDQMDSALVWPLIVRQSADATFLTFVSLMTVGLLWQLLRQRNKTEPHDQGSSNE